MIKLHPTDSDLVDFVEGTLSPAKSLLVSAHCDMCNCCREKSEIFTEQLASKVFDEPEQSTSILSDFVNMFSEITEDEELASTNNNGILANPSNVLQQIIKNELRDSRNHPNLTKSDALYLDGRKFILPKTLIRFTDRLGEWSKLVGKLWQAQIDIGNGQLAQFIYMEKDGSIPEHTHKGNELTLVIDGEFSDGISQYDSGDYINLNSSHTHTPCTASEEGCLVFSVIDQPLYFTSGWAKLVNPLSNLYFKVNSGQSISISKS